MPVDPSLYNELFQTKFNFRVTRQTLFPAYIITGKDLIYPLALIPPFGLYDLHNSICLIVPT